MHSWMQSEAGHNACPSLARLLAHAENASGVTSGLKEKPSYPCVPPLDVQIWMAWGKTNKTQTKTILVLLVPAAAAPPHAPLSPSLLLRS